MLGKYYESNHNNESNHKKYEISKVKLNQYEDSHKESY